MTAKLDLRKIKLEAGSHEPDSRFCVMFDGPLNDYGYGRVGKNGLAHRIAFEQAFGPIPARMFVCHRCDQPSCVNPEHLFLGTVADNNRDRHAKGRSRGLFTSGPNHPATKRRGGAHWQAKLSDEDVAEIREARARGVTTVVLASRYAVNTGTISRIARGIWRQSS